MSIKIDCYMSMKCASEKELRKNIEKALGELGIEAEVNYYRITDEEAEKLGLKGSPSIFINGKDIQPAQVRGFS